MWSHDLERESDAADEDAFAPPARCLNPQVKLLFHRIRPVFVFDGGAPALKARTLAARRKIRSEGTDASLRKTAQRILASQLKKHKVRAGRLSSRGRRGRDGGNLHARLVAWFGKRRRCDRPVRMCCSVGDGHEIIFRPVSTATIHNYKAARNREPARTCLNRG